MNLLEYTEVAPHLYVKKSKIQTGENRQVHCITAYRNEVVRYQDQGHWYLESRREGKRKRISLDEAVTLATKRNTRVFLGRKGGRAFDHAVRKRLQG
jgi:hypothetical protein